MTKVNAPKLLTSIRHRNQPMRDQETRTEAASERPTDSPVLEGTYPLIATQGLVSWTNRDFSPTDSIEARHCRRSKQTRLLLPVHGSVSASSINAAVGRGGGITPHSAVSPDCAETGIVAITPDGAIAPNCAIPPHRRASPHGRTSPHR